MKGKSYLLLCIALSTVIAVSILFVPGLADSLETWLLRVLSTNARVEI